MRNARLLIPIFVLVLAVDLATKNTLMGRLTYLLGAILIVSFLWSWLNIRRIQVFRQTRSRRAQVGQYVEERFAVRNLSMFPKLWLEVDDQSTLPGHHAGRVVNSLAGRKQRGWQVRTYARRRGRYTLGPITLSTGDPLGLFRFERHLPATSSMVVYPATIDLPRFEPPIGQLVGGEALRLRTQYVTTNVSGIRDYVPGDSFNRIHWPTSARRDRLMVKQFEIDPTADVWIVLDMQRDVHAGPPLDEREREMLPAMLANGVPPPPLTPNTEEYGVTVAASIARHFLIRNRSVGLITYGQDREVVQLDRGERQLSKILETLAVMRAVGRAPLEQVLTAEERLFGRNSVVIVITSSAFDPWVSILRDYRRRGASSVAVLVEASTFAANQPSAINVVSSLIASGVPTYLVKNGDAIDAALGQRASV
ncbi:MAG: DUF58 domain-containing protein [Anaerolineae bacterium]